MTQAAAQLAPVVQMIPLGSISESKSNPRKTFNGIEELAEDLKLRGVLQPVLVRQRTDPRRQDDPDFELVFGARRYRAAKLAKLPALPAFVRELTDEQTLELQIVENTQREDVHPLEEADGYRRLHEEFGYAIEDIAAKVGKSRSAVYERIKLCALVPAAREAFFAGRLSASTALLVARIPDKELQQKAVKDLAGGATGMEPMSYRQAVDHIHSRYMLQLKDAPFDVTDAALVARAGACSTCPKRTGNQRELFGDVKSPDVCTDPPCYRGKVDALWALRVAGAKEAGAAVMDEKTAKDVFKYGQVSHEYRDLSDEEYDGNKSRTVKSILGKDAPPPILARNPSTGTIHELVPRATVLKALKEKQPDRKPSPKEKAAEEKFRRERERDTAQRIAEGRIADAVLAALVAKAERGELKPAAWKFLAACLANRENYDFTEETAFRRAWLKEDEDNRAGDEVIEREVAKFSADQARGFVVEAVVTMNGAYGSARIDRMKGAALALGVDYDKLAREAKRPAKTVHTPPIKTEQIAEAVKKIKKLAAPKKPSKAKKAGKAKKK